MNNLSAEHELGRLIGLVEGQSQEIKSMREHFDNALENLRRELTTDIRDQKEDTSRRIESCHTRINRIEQTISDIPAVTRMKAANWLQAGIMTIGAVGLALHFIR